MRENGTFHRGMGPFEGSITIRSAEPREWTRATIAAKVSMSGLKGNAASSGASSRSAA
jgi:hypothetical protein